MDVWLDICDSSTLPQHTLCSPIHAVYNTCIHAISPNVSPIPASPLLSSPPVTQLQQRSAEHADAINKLAEAQTRLGEQVMSLQQLLEALQGAYGWVGGGWGLGVVGEWKCGGMRVYVCAV